MAGRGRSRLPDEQGVWCRDFIPLPVLLPPHSPPPFSLSQINKQIFKNNNYSTSLSIYLLIFKCTFVTSSPPSCSNLSCLYSRPAMLQCSGNYLSHHPSHHPSPFSYVVFLIYWSPHIPLLIHSLVLMEYISRASWRGAHWSKDSEVLLVFILLSRLIGSYRILDWISFSLGILKALPCSGATFLSLVCDLFPSHS